MLDVVDRIRLKITSHNVSKNKYVSFFQWKGNTSTYSDS